MMMKSKRYIGTLILVIALLAGAAGVLGVLAGPTALQGRLSRIARPDGDPAIRIDKRGYLAGDTIRISGTGFSPFESVMLRVAHTGGTVETGMGHEPWFVSADAGGAFKTTWSLNANDTAGVNLVLEAIGSSGLGAQASFVRRGRITTDRLSYRAGDRARITADGFRPNELVTIEVNDGHSQAPITTLSDKNGRATAELELPADNLGAGSFVVTAVSADSQIAVSITIPANFFTVIDQQGSNDQPGQKDLTRLGRDNTDPNYFSLYWSWDETGVWASNGNTGDACAIFDSDGDGNINFAICGEVHNPGGDTTQVTQTAGSPYVYSCSNGKNDRCTGPVGPLPFTSADVQAGVLGTLAAGNLITNTDPFDSSWLLGAGASYPNDTTLQMKILRSFLPANSVLANVCSYSSVGNGVNTSPGDCILTPGGGFLVIKKDAGADTATNFNFNVSPVPAGTPGSYTIIGSGQANPVGVEVGQNGWNGSVSEAVPPYWNLAAASCTLESGTPTGTWTGSTISSIGIESGKVTTCTFTNQDQTPKLTVTKVVVNDNGGTKQFSDFALFAGATSMTSGVQKAVATGTYTVSETGPSGYSATFSGDCASNGSITLNLADVKSCTITNDDVAPTLTVIKHVINNDGGTKAASDFTLNVTGGSPSPASFAGSESGTAVTLHAGSYSVAETGPSGYASSLSAACSGSIGIGETKTCTVTNNDIQPKLIVIKHVSNNNGGTSVAGDFTMSVTGNSPGPASFPGAESGTTVNLNAGTYSVGESGPAGYLGSYSTDCSGSIAIGQTKTCTVTNNDKSAELTIIKHVVNNSGGTATAGQWTMDVTGSNPSDNHFAGSEAGVVITMNAGSYSVNESGGPSGYAKTLSAGCSGTLAPGASVTCTITNDDIVASLTLTNFVVNNNGGTASPGVWTVSAAGPTPISGAGSATSGSSFAAGAYTLSESSGPAGYSASSWTCTGTGTQNGSQITLQLGQAAACTITNDDIAPSLTLVKIVSTGLGNDPAAPPSAFAIGTTGGPTNISGFGTASSGSTFKAGTYTLGESGLAGYTASGWVCTGQGTQSNNTITLGVGQTAACAITNNLNNIPPVIKVTKTASPKNLTSAGGTVTFTVTVTNQSGYYDPFTLTSLFDNVYGNLADPADAGYKPQDNNTCSLPQTIVPSGSYICTWQSTFPALDPHVTFSEHDIVIATGTDDDNAGPSSVGTATAEAFVLQAPPIAITDSSLCTFDTNSGLAGKQFNRLFTQDAQSFPHFKLTATNPGQFYWNVNVSGEKGSTVHVKLEV